MFPNIILETSPDILETSPVILGVIKPYIFVILPLKFLDIKISSFWNFCGPVRRNLVINPL